MSKSKINKSEVQDFKEIDLEDIEIGKAQTRTKNPSKGIHELAASIKRIGLLEPIIVSPSEVEGKYELITGQRRYLAYEELGLKTIKAVVLKKPTTELEAKVYSGSENLLREPLSSSDERDLCLILWNTYMNVDLIIQDTGIPAYKIRQYLKYPALMDSLKKLVDDEVVDTDAAYRAQRAADEKGTVTDEEAVNMAKELQGLSQPQRTKISKDIKENPDKNIDSAIEEGKTGGDLIHLKIILSGSVDRSLKQYARSESKSKGTAASELIEEGLEQKGFLDLE